MARPGTVDYSKWERMVAEISSDEEMPQTTFDPGRFLPPSREVDEVWNDADGSDADDDMSCEDAEFYGDSRALLTGSCANCGSPDASKRCSRCQAAWFCDQDCQAAAWPSHAASCFARSETEAWWGKLTAKGPELLNSAHEILPACIRNDSK